MIVVIRGLLNLNIGFSLIFDIYEIENLNVGLSSKFEPGKEFDIRDSKIKC